ncbi:metal-dependent hydrolase [Halorarius litoreus]|uniref:metal-dependent hydrolase n=1 Tax=Halorarius litoreus TaxID=2962676 RepID=UPI0020CC7096|nr:metal-dependent hydrolase [Halorarius litoreus]
MMATTHVLAAVAFATLSAVVAPEFALVAVVAAGLGGLFPDLDIYGDHRRTLHFPVYYPASAALAAALAVAVPTVATVAAAWFLAGAALHAVMDAFGGGLELRPWEATSDRAVYSHYHGRWLQPKRWVRYDGAPEDLLVAGLFAAPPLLVFDGHLPQAVAALLVFSAGYVMLRKPLASLWAWLAARLVPRLPHPLQTRVPERFVE